jgi:hypothetical protein
MSGLVRQFTASQTSARDHAGRHTLTLRLVSPGQVTRLHGCTVSLDAALTGFTFVFD